MSDLQVEAPQTRDEIEALCRKDMSFFGSVCAPATVKCPFPEFYEQVWAFIIKTVLELGYAEVCRIAIGLPRGHAKTTVIKLLVCYGILYDLGSFFLIVCANERRAQDFLDDIDELMSSPNVKQIYGDWSQSKGMDTKEQKTAIFNGRVIILAAIGVWGSMRGINVKRRRPDWIICDDVQTADCALSPGETAKLLNTLVSTIFKLGSEEKCLIIYLGNMYPDNCILAMFHAHPKWHSLITGAILADGSTLWEKLKPLHALIESYEHDNLLGLGASWFAEVQNDPQRNKGGLLPGGALPKLAEDDVVEWEGEQILASFITIDPAGRKRNSDDNVIAGHIVRGTDLKREVVMLDNGKYNPEEVIIKAINAALQQQATHIFVEGVGYQESMAFWAYKYLEEYQLTNTLKFLPIYPGKVAKLVRIRGLIGDILTGKVIIREADIRGKVLGQIIPFKVDRTDNVDDILDCIAYGNKAMEDHKVALIGAYGTGTGTQPRRRHGPLPISDPIAQRPRRGVNGRT